MGDREAVCDHVLFLQVTCERGFTSMEESHVKVVEELQRRHQQEVERLLVERDQLLDEESAATATGEERLISPVSNTSLSLLSVYIWMSLLWLNNTFRRVPAASDI